VEDEDVFLKPIEEIERFAAALVALDPDIELPGADYE
jgi:hypothetical protein